MERKYYEKLAADFAAVIKELSGNPKNLENLEAYLAVHFGVWMEKWASTPENLVEDLQMFSRMEIEDA